MRKVKGKGLKHGKLLSLWDGSFKAEGVAKLPSGKYAYKLTSKKIAGWKKHDGTWKVLASRRYPGGTQYTFAQLSKRRKK